MERSSPPGTGDAAATALLFVDNRDHRVIYSLTVNPATWGVSSLRMSGRVLAEQYDAPGVCAIRTTLYRWHEYF